MTITYGLRTGKSETVLGRLRRDVRGNTIAIMAAAMIPLAALAGSAIDAARLYVVKVRLQQACDAGALAGRKFMTSTDGTALDATATAQANAFFKNNFRLGWMGTKTAVFTPTKTTDQQVAGAASSQVPMTIMKMFGAGDVTLSVKCEARYDVADADIMFVLDTTGSMACTTADGTAGCSQPVATYTQDGNVNYYTVEKTGSKLSGLRSAVLNFYDTLAGNVDPTTNIRYGFVTYTSTVNAGYAVKELSSDYLVKNWNYESRRLTGDVNTGDSVKKTYYLVSLETCNSYAKRTPASGYPTNGLASVATVSWSGLLNIGTCVVTSQPVKPNWYYTQVNYDVSKFITGVPVPDPSKITGTTSVWQGCIEERNTNQGASTFDQSNLPADLDPDLVPTNDDTRWRPMWPDVIYYRGTGTTAVNTGVQYSGDSTTPYGDYYVKSTDQQTTSYTNMIANPNPAWNKNISTGYVSCGKRAQRLKKLTRDDVDDYVNADDFKAQGGTYHDTGMIWGTRMISPTGIFAADTAPWPGRAVPNRYIVFMTDGDMSPNYELYGMYGIERYDKRVTGGDSTEQLDDHNARFLAECAAAKARNIRVFVVGFGQTLTSQLSACASPGQAYFASDNAALQTAFKTIANQVAMLRVSK
ncbi:TadE/TadG family type IV pilus assembly protein [Sphingomonas sp. OK281]|uniref:TadE/TadG family type IV pilus assembly protein n=1 Tax=Sphingomonas sp. OK281 TaxID=1881067 RepID=UPI0008E36DD2|nr:TadE/TadG family type IV pilus assembly protein [Sphingomonas sp. OK281]SFN78471.1 Flp pilus assembly protein TadG [Sphingomonas sp. OK281]